MSNALQRHHLHQFSSRHQGVRYSLETGKLPRLDPQALRRLAGIATEQIRARRIAKAKTCIGIVGFVVMAAAGTVLIQGVL